MVHDGITRDPVKPALQFLGLAQRTESRLNLDEDLLENVFGICAFETRL